MKTKLIFLCLFLFLFSFCTTNYRLLKLGNSFDKIANNGYVLIPSGSMIKSVDLTIDNIEYILGVSSQMKVIFVSSFDIRLKIRGKKIGDEIGNRLSNVGYISGWGYYVKLNKDWYAGFDFTDKPNEKSKIKWFFKYKF